MNQDGTHLSPPACPLHKTVGQATDNIAGYLAAACFFLEPMGIEMSFGAWTASRTELQPLVRVTTTSIGRVGSLLSKMMIFSPFFRVRTNIDISIARRGATPDSARFVNLSE
jgi:hypothetical protein